MKILRYFIFAAALSLLIHSCVEDDVYRTSHPGSGAVVITADFSSRTEDSPVPDCYTLSVGGSWCVMPSGAASAYPGLFVPGEHAVTAYNVPGGMTAADGIVGLDRLPGGVYEALPGGHLHTYSGSVSVLADDTVRVTLPMSQRTRDVVLEFTVTEGDANRLSGVSGLLTGVSSGVEVATGSSTDMPVAVASEFVLDGVSVTSRMRLPGVTGGSQMLRLNIAFTDGSTQNTDVDMTALLRGFHNDMLTPLVIRGNLLVPTESGFTVTVENLELGDSEDVDLY